MNINCDSPNILKLNYDGKLFMKDRWEVYSHLFGCTHPQVKGLFDIRTHNSVYSVRYRNNAWWQ